MSESPIEFESDKERQGYQSEMDPTPMGEGVETNEERLLRLFGTVEDPRRR